MKTISEAKAKKITKIQKMIDKYNRKASKWGYPTIVLQDNGWPSPFGYSEIKDGNSFWDVFHERSVVNDDEEFACLVVL